MKILHILSSNKFSGAENIAAEIISMFKGEIEMAYMSPNGDICKSLHERDIIFFPIEDFSIKKIGKVIKDYKPDIIHAHDIRATIQAVRCLNKIPIISHIHGNHDDMKVISIKSLLYLFSSLRVRHIIAVSDSVINEYVFSRFVREKCTVMYNFINKDRIIEKINEDKTDYNFDFVFLGRLVNPKNPERVAMVASKVLKKLQDVRFGIIGDGNLRRNMENIFISEGVQERVTFCGYMNNPYKALSQAKAIIMCSRYEGTPIAALEAMVLGVPIISTPVDGMKEIIKNWENGFISNNDDVLVDYVCSVIKNKELNSKLSVGARKSVLKFAEIGSYKKRLMNIYENVTMA